MPFSRLTFFGFRNIDDTEVPVHAEQVFFIGENGQGKTNFLEAVYLLCYGRSFRISKDLHLVKQGENDMSVSGQFSAAEDGDRSTTTRILIKNKKKEIFVDDKLISDRKELLDLRPCIVFCHDDLNYVRGAPEYQRLFLDQTGSLLYPSYLADLRDYGKVLRTRNLLLKDNRTDLLEIYDLQLSSLGMKLVQKRREIISEFNAVFTPLFSLISEDQAKLELRYRASWENLSQDQIMAKLAEKRNVDLALKTSTSGPHRDKIEYYRDEDNFSFSASTGQFRLMSLLLRLSQAKMIRYLCGKKAVLLLDDVLLELDPAKRNRFLDNLPENDQAFFTFLPDENITPTRKRNSLKYRVKGGKFYEESL